jgi:hypothetical protein
MHKPVGMRSEGCGQDLRSVGDELVGQPVVNGMRGEQADAAVSVFGVVLGEECPAERAGILDVAKGVGIGQFAGDFVRRHFLGCPGGDTGGSGFSGGCIAGQSADQDDHQEIGSKMIQPESSKSSL